jgi:hypothetical protein
VVVLGDRVYDRGFSLRGLFLRRRRSNVWVKRKVAGEQVHQVLVHRHFDERSNREIDVLPMLAFCTTTRGAAYLAAMDLGKCKSNSKRAVLVVIDAGDEEV